MCSSRLAFLAWSLMYSDWNLASAVGVKSWGLNVAGLLTGSPGVRLLGLGVGVSGASSDFSGDFSSFGPFPGGSAASNLKNSP